MNYFVNFVNSGDHLSYVLSSYLIVFSIIFLIFILSNSKTKKLEKEFVNLIKNEKKNKRLITILIFMALFTFGCAILLYQFERKLNFFLLTN